MGKPAQGSQSWNRLRSKVVTEYIMLVDLYLIVMWACIQLLSVYEVLSDHSKDYFEYNIPRNEYFANISPLLLWVIFIIAIATSLLNLIRKMFLYRLAKYRSDSNLIQEFFQLFIVEIPIETVIILTNPLPFMLNQKRFDFTEIKIYETQIGYFDNEMMQLSAIFKLFILVRAVLTRTIYSTERAYRVCQIFNANQNYRFVVRCIMRERPFALSFAWLAIGVLYFGHAIRITEKPLKQASDRMDHSPYANCMWAAFITMSTVGYGDFFPRTNRGRVVMVICCMYGVVNLSLVVASVTQFLMMGRKEDKSYLLVKRVEMKKNIKRLAGTIVNYCCKFGIVKKKDYNQADRIIEKIQETFEDLKDANEEYKNLTQEVPIEDKARTGFDRILAELNNLKVDVKEICNILEIDQKLALAGTAKTPMTNFSR